MRNKRAPAAVLKGRILFCHFRNKSIKNHFEHQDYTFHKSIYADKFLTVIFWQLPHYCRLAIKAQGTEEGWWNSPVHSQLDNAEASPMLSSDYLKRNLPLVLWLYIKPSCFLLLSIKLSAEFSRYFPAFVALISLRPFDHFKNVAFQKALQELCLSSHSITNIKTTENQRRSRQKQHIAPTCQLSVFITSWRFVLCGFMDHSAGQHCHKTLKDFSCQPKNTKVCKHLKLLSTTFTAPTAKALCSNTVF